MFSRWKHARKYIIALCIAFCAFLITITVVRFPDDAFDASLAGLMLWFEIVLPALLPFFILSEILLGLGVIRAIGVLLEPLMRPVFRIPGVGAFTLAMGLVSGYPLGAKLTGRLRREQLCTREEGERLISFANTADPLFMIGAVAFGMFGDASLGMTLVVAHYAAAFIIGFLLRYHAKGAMGMEKQQKKRRIWIRALDEMIEARQRDGRPISVLFGDAVRDTMASMVFIGGCIMMFSVFIRLLAVSGLGDAIASLIAFTLKPIGFDAALAPALLHGLMEITLGAQSTAEATSDIFQRLLAASFVIGWSGFSVHAQVAAMVHNTDLRLTPYIVSRFGHGVLAALLTWFLYKPLSAVTASTGFIGTLWQPTAWWHIPIVIFVLFLTLLLVFTIVSLLIYVLRSIRIHVFRT